MIISESRKILEQLSKEDLEKMIPNFSSMRAMFNSLSVKYSPIHCNNFNRIKKRLKIKAKFYEKTNHPDLKYNIFKTINTKEKAYWLGFIAADGYVPASANKVAFSMSVKDQDHFDKFLEFIYANKLTKRYFLGRSENRMFQIEISNKKFAQHIKNLGIISPKSNNLRLPMLKNKVLMRAFILGLYDGDGHFSNGSASISSGSKKLLKDINDCWESKYTIAKKNNHWGSVFSMLLCRYQLYIAQKENKNYNLKRKNVLPRKKGEKKQPPQEIFVSAADKSEMKKLGRLCLCGRLKNKVAKQCFICYKKRSLKFTKMQLIKDLKEIKSLTQVGKKYGMSANAIGQNAKKMKIQYKKYLSNPKRYNPKNNKEIVAYYIKNKSILKTSQHFRIAIETVSRLVKNTKTYQSKLNHLAEVKILKLKIKKMKTIHTFSEIATKLNISYQRAKSLYYS